MSGLHAVAASFQPCLGLPIMHILGLTVMVIRLAAATSSPHSLLGIIFVFQDASNA